MIDSLSLLRDLNACNDAASWAAAQPDASPAALWTTCPRGDWMAWYVGRLASGTATGSPEHRRAVLVAVLCARTATHLIPAPHRAEIEGALGQIEAWAWGDAAVDRGAVWSRISRARGALWRDASAAAASAAAASAYAASASAYAAYAYAYAADAYAYAADAWHTARARHLADLADLIRSAIPTPPLPASPAARAA